MPPTLTFYCVGELRWRLRAYSTSRFDTGPCLPPSRAVFRLRHFSWAFSYGDTGKIFAGLTLAYYADKQEAMTVAFGEATAASRQMKDACQKALSDLDGIRDFLSDMQEKIASRHATEIMQDRLEQQGDTDTVPLEGQREAGVLWSRRTQADASNPDVLYRSMMAAWDRFLDVFRQKLVGAGINPNMARIGKMTYALTDRRRRKPLPLETADLVSALNSQYRRYLAKQATKAEWMTRQAHDDFVRLVETAIKELGGATPNLPPADPIADPQERTLM